MKRKQKIMVIIIAIVAVIIFPFAVGKGVSSEIFMEWTNSNDWIGFWASYAASLIGIAIPIIIFYMQRAEDRKQSSLPTLSAYQRNGTSGNQDNFDFTIDYLWYNDVLGEYVLGDEKNSTTEKEVKDGTKWFHTELIVKNIGLGPVMNLSIGVVGEERKESDFSICLAENGTALYKIYISAEKLKLNDNSLVFHFTNVYKKGYKQTINFGMCQSPDKTNKEKKLWTLSKFGSISKLEEE